MPSHKFRGVASLAELEATPVQRVFVADDGALWWSLRPALAGVVLPADGRALEAVHGGLRALAATRAAAGLVVDARQLEPEEQRALAADWATRAPRRATLLAGADDEHVAMRAAGGSDDDARLVQQLAAAERGPARLLALLRSWLALSLKHAVLDDAARALHVSVRSLQRHLLQARSSFRDELYDARMTAARRLLTTGTLKVGLIAGEVGFASVPHFVDSFRRTIGVTPGRYRRGERAVAPAALPAVREPLATATKLSA